MPKQFVKLLGNRSLFQNTVRRNLELCQERIIISNQEQYFLTLDQLEELQVKSSRYLLEPVAKNTAPAIALACLALDPEALVLVTPSDHLIQDQESYEKAVQKAEILAADGYLVTFGITPTGPVTSYGYIESAGDDVISFKEKPDYTTAQRYLEEGNYHWNSGMFCFQVGTFLEELEKYSREIFIKSKEAISGLAKQEIVRVSTAGMSAIPKDSIDYAVLEKSTRVKVVPADIGWNDLGSFSSLYDELPKNQNGNALGENSKTEPICIDSTNNLILGSNRQIATIDLEDMAIIDTPDALMISPRKSTQKIRQVVQLLKEKGSELYRIHQTAHRPWGTYTVLEEEENYKIKRIVVHPGARLSLQKHFHRSEHWVVVAGTGTVTVGNEVKSIKPNQSTYIAKEEVHRLENMGEVDLVLIEVQIGEYLGEDDIVRLKDDFQRG
jgi:mannose-1-phosphate guanylyltransferase